MIYLSCVVFRMKAAGIDMSQGVRQMAAQQSVSLTEDLLKTKRMTIENLIEATEVNSISLLHIICCMLISNMNKKFQ